MPKRRQWREEGELTRLRLDLDLLLVLAEEVQLLPVDQVNTRFHFRAYIAVDAGVLVAGVAGDVAPHAKGQLAAALGRAGCVCVLGHVECPRLRCGLVFVPFKCFSLAVMSFCFFSGDFACERKGRGQGEGVSGRTGLARSCFPA